MSDATTFKHPLTGQIYITEVRTKTKNIESDIIRFINNIKEIRIIYCLPQKK
jgi:ATP-dependent DNA helicase RecQ